MKPATQNPRGKDSQWMALMQLREKAVTEPPVPRSVRDFLTRI
jgi:hypothetical protein